MKKRIVNTLQGIALCLIVATLLAACCPTPSDDVEATKAPDATTAPDAGDITIAYSGFATSNDFWNTLGKAAAAEAEAQGVEFIDLTTETQDAAAQKAAVDNAITQGVDAIIIGSVDNRVWGDTIEKAKDAEIPILAVDTAIDDPYISSLIQTDNVSAAGLAGDYICDQTGGEGTILVIGGSVGHQTGDARKDGVTEKAEACGLTVIGEWSDWNEENAVSVTQNTLAANPDLKAIFVAWDPGAAAVAALVKQKGLTDQVLVVGFDALPVMLKVIKAGEGSATVKQDNVRMGQEIVVNAVKVVQGESVDELVLIPGILVTADNVDDYLEE